MDPRPDRGTLHVATGQRFVDEAEESARSFKRHMPHLACAVIVDDVSLVSDDTCFDVVEPLARTPEYSFFDRIPALKDTPFERTLYLDTDTECIAACDEVFDLLDRFDVAAAHAPWRVAYATYRDFASWYEPTRTPLAFPEMNCGVILYRSGPDFDALVDDWEARYLADREASGLGRRTTDQPSFRDALYHSDLAVGVLTPEYNLRTPFPYFAGGNSPVRILHGRGELLEDVRVEVNRSDRPRTGGVPSRYWIAKKVSRRLRRVLDRSGRDA